MRIVIVVVGLIVIALAIGAGVILDSHPVSHLAPVVSTWQPIWPSFDPTHAAYSTVQTCYTPLHCITQASVGNVLVTP